jgi:diguanylate cyclase (GGDEF)-like protein
MAQYARLCSPTRIAALEATGLLNGRANPVLDRVAGMVTRLLRVPIGVVSLVHRAQQHFPGMSGLEGSAGETRATPLSHSYCQYVVLRDAAFVLNDAAADPVYGHHAAHRELGVAAYAGVPLRTSDGQMLGALCAVHTAPMEWTADHIATLEELAAMAMAEIELRATTRALAMANRKLTDQLVRDPLTGVLNRIGFNARAAVELESARRARSPLLLCLLDLNDFHGINARLGHDVGDTALVETAALLEGALRDTDVLARTGADEFVALIANASDADIPYVTARLAASFDVHNATRNREFSLDASLGFAALDPATPVSMSTLLQRAEQAMRASRAAARNQVGMPSRDRRSCHQATGRV